MMIMGRAEIRAARFLEKNPIEACNEVQRKFCPELFNRFGRILDPRHQSYIIYTGKTMLGQMYYKGIAGITSMQDMTDRFNNPQIVENLASYIGVALDEYLPHYVTENDYLKQLPPDELQNAIHEMVYELIRRKSFYDARFMGKWIIIVDGTQLYSGDKKINDKCLERHYNKGTEQETVNYHIGFNRQKNWQADITHACSWNEWALKNHYLMQQISDFMKQLYEHYVLKKLGIKKKQKNISSELLESLARQITAEDIFRGDKQSLSIN